MSDIKQKVEDHPDCPREGDSWNEDALPEGVDDVVTQFLETARWGPRSLQIYDYGGTFFGVKIYQTEDECFFEGFEWEVEQYEFTETRWRAVK